MVVVRLTTRDFSGCWGIDFSGFRATPELIARVKATPLPNGEPVSFVVRPVFFGPPKDTDIDAAELQAWLAAKIGVALYQHPRFPKDNVLSHQTGVDDTAWFVRNALAVGYDPSKLIPGSLPLLATPDLEGVQNPPSVPYAAACTTGLRAAGFGPLLYLGFACGLKSADCDAMPGDPVWWPDFAPLDERPRPARGIAMHQHPQIQFCGFPADLDEAIAGGGFRALVDQDLFDDPLPANPVQVDQKT